jgi:phosphoribosylamine-glycine ligase
MNVLLISNSASFHHLSKILSKASSIDGIYHYGANPKIKSEEKYFPSFLDIAYTRSVNDQMQVLVNDISHQKIDLILASGMPPATSTILRSYLDSKQIPNLIPKPFMIALENDRLVAKKMLSKLGIPHSKGRLVPTWFLFRDFFKYPRPFVLKVNKTFKHGRQTMIITDDNIDDLFPKLFSKFLNNEDTIFSFDTNSEIIVEDFIKIKREISYHVIMNENSWKYIGSARDYKKEKNNDQGLLVDSMGSYFIYEVPEQLHEYSEKIFNYLKKANKPYNGFLFLGIGIGEDDVPYVLEINTRPGDPEIAVIANSIKNFTDILINTSIKSSIPDAKVAGESVAVSINNKDENWNKVATDLPNFKNVPTEISHCLTGAIQVKSKHSLFVSTGTTKEHAANKIFDYLKTQELGQFYYRSDIALLE